MVFDIIAWQLEGTNFALAASPKGIEFLGADVPQPLGAELFEDFVQGLPEDMCIGILCPDGQICKYFMSGVLH